MAKHALVTGCSAGGIGWSLCKELQKHGIHVFATARNLEKLGDLSDLSNVTSIALDVTKPESVAAARDVVTKVTGGKLDYLINNSGAQYVAPILDFDVQYGRDMFEVNVWGVISMVQAFAPLLIAAKGTVVNVASIAGFLNVPYMGVYGGSKAAVNLISETMRVELAPFNVKVITCITGAVKTNLMSNSYKQSLPENSIYQPASKEILERASGAEEVDRCSSEEFAEKVVKDALSGTSGLVYRGKMASISSILSTFLPAWILVRCPRDPRVKITDILGRLVVTRDRAGKATRQGEWAAVMMSIISLYPIETVVPAAFRDVEALQGILPSTS